MRKGSGRRSGSAAASGQRGRPPCRRALGSRSAPNGPRARLLSAVCPLPADVTGTLGIFPFEVKGRKGERQGKIRTLHYFGCCPPAPLTAELGGWMLQGLALG